MGQALCKGLCRSAYFYDLSKVEFTVDQQHALERDIKSEKMIIFSKSYCPHCVSAKQFLENHDVTSFKVVELNMDEEGLEKQAILFHITGQKTVPNIFIGGTHIGGNDHLHQLAKSGQLKENLDRHGIENSF